MNDMAEVKDMFTTLITEQSVLRGDVKEINSRLSDLIRLEQMQINQDAAMSRMGDVIDEQKRKVQAMEVALFDVRLATARTMAKVALLSGGSASGVLGLIWLIVKIFTENGVTP